MSTTPASANPHSAEPIRILLVDDHPATRLGTRTLIVQAQPAAEVVEAGTAAHALAQLQEGAFHLVFLDIKLPESDGVIETIETGKRTLARIRELDGPPVVVMSGERDRQLIEDMMGLGAATFVPKSADVSITMEAVRRALNGGVWLPPEMLSTKGGVSPPPSTPALLVPAPRTISHEDLGLTPREFEVLRLALNGLPPKRISLTLEINHDNVKKYMARLYEKFGTANQASLHAHFAKTGQTLGILRSATKAGSSAKAGSSSN